MAKTTLQKPAKNGNRLLKVELEDDEDFFVMKRGKFYKLGYPSDEVYPAHQLIDAREVYWNSVSQEWEQED